VFITSSSESSYTKAKQLLAERYGDPHRVSDAYKVKLKKWPKVKDGDSWLKMAIKNTQISFVAAQKL
jgi:hypothetical protein